MSDDLRRVQTTWDALSHGDDVFNAIFGWPHRPGQTVDEFLASGEAEIAGRLRFAERFHLPEQRRSALDFGCGAGRLTQALASQFGRAVGVDVAPGMIELARSLNRQGERCEFVLNEEPALERFDADSFDFVYSVLVLQHLPADLQRRYAAELARVLAPGGLLVFQAADELVKAEPLPLEAMVAEIRPERQRLRLAAGTQGSLRVHVRNRSEHVWPGGIGRGMVALTSGADRAYLERDVGPGEEVVLELAVTAPREPGEYPLALDLLQEHVRRFSERYGKERLSLRRTRPARVVLEVVEAAGSDDAPAAPPVPEMHGLLRVDALAAVQAAGGRVLDVTEDDHAGPGWRSLTYWATKG
ncbi:MAG TPA: methyltransferase domain-containing protein [Gaiellaceae bacterium]|nr:methyltransferase domain-containing protein [Gaiellaceae bacterium]